MAKKYTPEEAEKWGWEELVASIGAPAGYIFISIGLALVLLLKPVGWVYLVIGVVATLVMYFVMDPKLRAVSDEYERRQAEFLKHVESISKWEDKDE